MICIVRGAQPDVIALQVSWQDVGVGRIEMIQELAGGGLTISGITVAKGTDIHFFNCGQYQLTECFVGSVTLVKECRSRLESVPEVVDLGTGGSVRNYGRGARVDWHDQGNARECGVDGGGDG